jgi:ankyrin repeat protein
VDIIQLLLDKRMFVNFAKINGSTPLDISAQFGRLDAVNIWLKKVLL